MYLTIDTSQRIHLYKVKAERTDSGAILLLPQTRNYSICMGDEAAREIVKQLTALLEPAKPERPLDDDGNEIDPRGYVFIARDGKAWGHLDAPIFRGPRKLADRPFLSVDEALDASMGFAFGPVVFEVWTPESGVPPMPEVTP